MSEFNHVSVLKKASVYFDGKVTSRTIKFADGSHKTLGIMLPGDYEFGTAEREIMEITVGELEVLIDETKGWQSIVGGQEFEVPANSKFKLKVSAVTDYCCSYLKD
ncbi:pyrimidine/purine nucleoside phosphorylase [Alginatibacterium sediminis]|uniref:Pyrimidine/purine nucleoside phosphorylase n=1 Tax=Alginatibacterium sediminis TaxID=2164068 RepID=A0A420E9Q5_9ALTE|nr:pyrimidine/purine nucleoside phosphorylase [Alginatibacterium sediminis]RKF17403.1 pyrimidine/purine nucleoside phosphorylase [Alginatibacterium sediminis]